MHRSILIVLPHGSEAAEQRARGLAVPLRDRGDTITLVRPASAWRRGGGNYDCVISLSPGWAPHLSAYRLSRAGLPWIGDAQSIGALLVQDGDADRRLRRRLERRLVLVSDAVTCADTHTRRAIFEHLAATAAVTPDNDRDAIDRQVSAVRKGPSGAEAGLRILMIGPVNSPHMEDLAIAMKKRGHVVHAGGAVWGGGLPPSRLPDAGIPTSVMMWPQTLWLRRTVKRFRPDVIHASWMPFATIAALVGARPLVAMAWGSDVYLAERLSVLGNRLAVRRADYVLADSNALVRRLIDLGAPRCRTGLVNWGVDLITFRPVASVAERATLRASLALRDAPVVISPRGVKPLYNPQVMIEAFQRLVAVVPEAQLVVKHQGDQIPELGELNGDPRVHVVGRVPYERMADYFRAADVCVSIPDTDSSPRSVWEAMACGCACVLSDLPWVHELIRPEDHALVVRVGAEPVAKGVHRLLTEPELRERLARNGRLLVEQHRNAATEMDRLEALYFRLASRPPRGDPESTAASSSAASSPVSLRRE